MSSDFVVGNYKIQSKEAYEILKAADVLSDSKLKRLDKNSDCTISEDELVEFAGEEDTQNNSSTTSNTQITEDVQAKIDSYYAQIANIERTISDLGKQLNQINSQICNGQDTSDETSQVVQNAQNIRNQISQQRTQIYNLLVQAENAVTSATNNTQTTGMNTVSTPVSADSSGVASYALQFDGKSASEMQSIMQGAGCAFHSGAWCADFVTFITKQVYGNNTPGDFANSCSNTAYCPTIGSWAQQKGILTTDSSQVQPGDFILYGSPGSFYHIGLVTSVNADGTVNTIEGNTSDDNGNYTNGVVNQHSNRTGYYVLMHKA